MPLKHGSSQGVFSYNVAELIKAGHPQNQAAAIAYKQESKDVVPLHYFTPEKISEKQSMTPEGFLLCTDVPIARTGVMQYALDEVPIEPGRDPYIDVYRDEDEVFRPETVASFVGKPVTNDHPPENVDPENFKQHVEGIIIKAARGEGINDKYIMADLLIMGKDAISAIREGKREVSAGYNADYEQLQPGRGRQTNIIGNHVALVDRGRCGPSCAIGDRRPNMTAKRQTWFDCVRAAFKNKDETALEQILREAANDGGEGVHLHVYPPNQKVTDKDKEDDMEEKEKKDMNDRMAKIEDSLAKIAKSLDKKAKDKDYEEEEKKKKDDGETDDTGESTEEMAKIEVCDDEEEEEKEDKKEKKTGDAATHYRMWQDTASRAELIAPGFRVPTFDAVEKSTAKVRDALCTCKRKILDKAYESDEGRAIIDPLLQGRKADFSKMLHNTLDALFVSVSEVYRATNNAKRVTHDNRGVPAADAFKKGGIDKLNKSFWDSRKLK